MAARLALAPKPRTRTYFGATYRPQPLLRLRERVPRDIIKTDELFRCF